ncbi:glutathione transferase [Ideonella azotifigens]|uniref:Glutathione transferase n=1 Tax=Ideonella azotifigens TaxID=513160 RepID=A0ABP3V7E4_9BURK|nr:glutathione transferase [Ideonella azotifigens]MCD2342573.1 glutathione transferase [Ideonella azotifigens]
MRQLYVDAQYASPYAMSVFVALHEKGLPFEMHTVDLGADAHKAATLAGTLLTQRVPTLIEDDGFNLAESSAITEFLEDTAAGPALYPTSPRQRAHARQVQAWLRSDLMPIRVERPTEVIFFAQRRAPLSVEAEAAAQKLFSVADTLLHGHSDDLFGEWCLADLDLALMLNRLVMHGDPVPAHLAAYATRQWQRRSVREWLALPRPGLSLS